MAEENKNDRPTQHKNIVKVEKKDAPAESRQGKEKEKMKLGAKIKKFFRDYKSEMKKIVWPTRTQVLKNTGVVLVAIIFIAVIVGVLDLVFGLGVSQLGKI